MVVVVGISSLKRLLGLYANTQALESRAQCWVVAGTGLSQLQGLCHAAGWIIPPSKMPGPFGEKQK